MKVYQLCAILVLLGVISTSDAVNIKSSSSQYQSIKQSQLDKLQNSLAESRPDSYEFAMTDAQSDAEVSSVAQSQMFIIDDFFVWLWCKITNCSKHQDAPQAAPQKERVKTVEVEKNTTKNDSNKSNGSNSTNATKKDDGAKTESKAGAEPVGLDDDILKQAMEKKAAQSKERDAGVVGDSTKKSAEDAVANNKDMASGEGNTLKDETPAQLAARQKQAQQQVQRKLAEQKPETMSNARKEVAEPVAGKSRIVDTTK